MIFSYTVLLTLNDYHQKSKIKLQLSFEISKMDFSFAALKKMTVHKTVATEAFQRMFYQKWKMENFNFVPFPADFAE